MSKNFALIGVGGYIAPRHLQAIRDSHNQLVAAVDRNDSVGIIDRYFDEVAYFVEFERFDRYVEKLRRLGEDRRVHYVSICSPNYLHDAHIRFALRVGADAICEKPLVLSPWNLDALADMEVETGRKIHTILQLRMHPALLDLRRRVDQSTESCKWDVDLTYITTRGNWYFVSWKGDVQKSGGVATNIGIHFFDLLLWIFGSPRMLELHYSDASKVGGYLELEKAHVRWLLSLDRKDLPQAEKDAGRTSFRSLRVDGQEIEFSGGFTDLHTTVYQEILAGRGFGIEDARPSINLAYQVRNAHPVGTNEYSHPLLRGETFLRPGQYRPASQEQTLTENRWA
jgi:UDP-N-acetyl-2-amino-2-deoxyglucuronate dehydrogenase